MDLTIPPPEEHEMYGMSPQHEAELSYRREQLRQGAVARRQRQRVKQRRKNRTDSVTDL
ncbi:hypothetical protein [Nocardioides sp. KR10-350]|uniref:hypothetical protein n=1 Tax=Nocardioides cheoyonin TaxID=3156615 RepID=UPI0032B43E67